MPTNRPHRSEEHTSELQSRGHLVCRLLLEKKKTKNENGRRKRGQTHGLTGVCNLDHRDWHRLTGKGLSVGGLGIRSCVNLFFFFNGTGTPEVLPLSPAHPFPN